MQPGESEREFDIWKILFREDARGFSNWKRTLLTESRGVRNASSYSFTEVHRVDIFFLARTSQPSLLLEACLAS